MSAYPGKPREKTAAQMLVDEMVKQGVVERESLMLLAVAEVMAYIQRQAKALGVEPTSVHCPDRRKWMELSLSHHSVLPAEAILRMRAGNDFMKFARLKHNGNLREACFAVAQQHLRELEAAQS